MRELHGRWPVQPRREFLAKLLRVTGLLLLSTPPAYWAFTRACRRGGLDLDEVVQGSVRGFAGGNFFTKIRRRPSTPLLALLARRLERFDPVRVAERGAVGEELLERLPPELVLPGCDAPHRSHWVVSVLSDAPELLEAELFRRGFDATRRATLDAVPPPQERPWARARRAEELIERLVYLPVYPQAPFAARARLAATLAAHAQRSRGALAAT
jgi:dTDP-4-amino-4,6-dideoxygalactose transaminase